MARTSLRVSRQEQDIREIGARLSVENVPKGVRRSGSRIRVTAQLVKARDAITWESTLRPEMTDVFAIQDEISQAIVEKLRVCWRVHCPLAKRQLRTWKPTTCF